MIKANTSSLPTKTLTIVGGEASTIIQPSVYPWLDRVFEVVSSSGTSLSVTFQELTITGETQPEAEFSAAMWPWARLVLIDGGTVRMTNVAVVDNEDTAPSRGPPLERPGLAGQTGGGRWCGGRRQGGESTSPPARRR